MERQSRQRRLEKRQRRLEKRQRRLEKRERELLLQTRDKDKERERERERGANHRPKLKMKLVQYLIAFAAVLIGGVAMASETSLHDALAAKAKTSLRSTAEAVRRQSCHSSQHLCVFFNLTLTCLVLCVLLLWP